MSGNEPFDTRFADMEAKDPTEKLDQLINCWDNEFPDLEQFLKELQQPELLSDSAETVLESTSSSSDVVIVTEGKRARTSTSSLKLKRFKNSHNENQPEESYPFVIQGILSSTGASCMIDSGSFANLIDSEFLFGIMNHDAECVRVFELVRPKKMDGALKGSFHESTLGAELEIKFSDTLSELISFFIIEKQNKYPPILLGLPFIKKHWEILDWENLQLKFT